MTNGGMRQAARAVLDRIEFPVLLVGLAIAGALWALVELAEVARDAAPHTFDTAILLAFRQPGHPDVSADSLSDGSGCGLVGEGGGAG